MVSASNGSFWGLVLEPNKDYTHNVSKAFRITMAALDITAGNNNAQVTVYAKVDKVNYVVCNLESKHYQQSLDLSFDSGVVTFHVKGGRSVHLTGYLLPGGNSADRSVMKRKTALGTDGAGGKKSRLLSSDIFIDEEDMFEEDSSDDEFDDMDSDELEMLEEEESSEQDSEEELTTLMMNKKKDTGNEVKTPATPKANKVTGGNKAVTPSTEAKDQKKQKQTPKSENKDKNVKPGTPYPKGTTPVVAPNTTESNKKKKKKKSLADESLNGSEKKTPKVASAKKTVKGGIIVEDLLVGNGPEVETGKKVGFYYIGKLQKTQKLFDSRSTGKPLQMKVGAGEMIEGLDRGLVGMKVGGKRRLIIPPKLAYGAEGVDPQIPPNSTLTFDIDLKYVS